MYMRKSAAFRNALKFNRPISQFLMCPDSGEQTSVGARREIEGDVSDMGKARRPQEFVEDSVENGPSAGAREPIDKVENVFAIHLRASGESQAAL